jgi:hypothetical protein
MNFFKFNTKKQFREKLLRSETEARLRGPGQQAEDPEQCLLATTGASMTEGDEIRYRRIMAMLHYGEPTANPEHEAPLAEGERDYLDVYVIQQRWAKLWLERKKIDPDSTE